jgi:hypothetical protein
LPEISSEWLGKSIQLPATHTVLDVRPPEASGADLFAVGRIVAWMNLGSDPSIEFLARWLSHGDHRVRLRDVQLARHLAKRMLLAREGGSAPSPEGLEGRFLDELLRFAAASKDKATRLEERQVHLQRDLEALQAERPKLMAELEASRERSRELQESLQGARQAAAEAEARQREALASRARRRFRSAREFWSSVRRLLGRGRCE